MPIMMTLKNIPDTIYDRLKASAEIHHRSLNREAIACLEAALTPAQMAPEERLARARRLRAALGGLNFKAGDIDSLKRKGRP